MAVPDNIEFFNQLTLAILNHLYGTFPRQIELEVKSLAASFLSEEDDTEQAFARLSSADDTVDFLTSEGFITHSGPLLHGGSYLQTRLTAKGLAALNSTPASLASKKQLSSQIREVVAGGLSAAAKDTVKHLANAVVSFAVSAGQGGGSSVA